MGDGMVTRIDAFENSAAPVFRFLSAMHGYLKQIHAKGQGEVFENLQLCSKNAHLMFKLPDPVVPSISRTVIAKGNAVTSPEALRIRASNFSG